MKLAPIVPTGAESLIPEEIERFFCFTNLVDVAGNAYVDSFKDRTGVILDSFVYEDALPEDPIVWAAKVKLISAHMVFIPDVRFNMSATLTMFGEHWDALEDIIDPEAYLVGIPQGQNLQELTEAAETMLLKEDVVYLAIPHHTARLCGVPRSEIVTLWQKLFEGDLEGIHLLGAFWPYTDERLMADWDIVKSMDTAEPANAAIFGTSLRVPSAETAVVRPANFFQLKNLLTLQQELFTQNVRELQKWIS